MGHFLGNNLRISVIALFALSALTLGIACIGSQAPPGPAGAVAPAGSASAQQTAPSDEIEIGASDYKITTIWGDQPGYGISFTSPNGIATDSSDNVYVIEFRGNRVQQFTFDSVLVARWGSARSEDGQFQNPTGIAIDGEGNVYVSESGNHRVQKFDSDGNWLTSWGSRGPGEGEFLSAMVIAADSESKLYVSDWGNDRIQVFDTDRNYLDSWGLSGKGPGELFTSTGIKVDGYANLWVLTAGTTGFRSLPGMENSWARGGLRAITKVNLVFRPASLSTTTATSTSPKSRIHGCRLLIRKGNTSQNLLRDPFLVPMTWHSTVKVAFTLPIPETIS